MNHTIADVKSNLSTIVSKVMGLSPQPISDEELCILIFAIESNVIFDSVGQKILPSLKTVKELPVEPFVSPTPTEEELQQYDEYTRLVEDRERQIKGLFYAGILENFNKEMRMRFGV